MPAKREIIIGQKFGKLKIIKELPKHITSGGNKCRKFECLCECGKSKSVLLNSLLTEKTVSCGCFHLERVISAGKKRFKHKKINTGAYKSWLSMRKRCNYEKDAKKYKYYGGRGIAYCKEWEDFNNFFRDMGDRPTGKTLDRINVNGHYIPSNCRWATASEQALNRRSSQAFKR
jgi:hypothetical protein